MNAKELRIRVLMTLQVALLGRVTANMQSVLVSWSDKDVRVRVVFDRAITSEDIELVSEIETEVISHLPEHAVSCQAEVGSTSAKTQLYANEVPVFQRASVV